MEILQWSWWKNLKWTFYLDEKLPPKHLISSVWAFAFYNDSILITKNHRWWEHPWWHIENWENIKEAIIREIKEEVWAQVKSMKNIWYFRLNPDYPIKRSDWTTYPFPHSYVPYYICECNEIGDFTWEEILETKQIKISQIDNYQFSNKDVLKIILKYR